MQVVIFYGNVDHPEAKAKLQETINTFLRGLPKSDITKFQTIPCEQGHAAVFVWLKTDAREAENGE